MDTRQEPAHTPINIIYLSPSLATRLIRAGTKRTKLSTQLKVREQF